MRAFEFEALQKRGDGAKGGGRPADIVVRDEIEIKVGGYGGISVRT